MPLPGFALHGRTHYPLHEITPAGNRGFAPVPQLVKGQQNSVGEDARLIFTMTGLRFALFSESRKIGIWRAVRTGHSEKVAHYFVGISIEFRTIYRHPFVGDGFPVPRNSETCMGRDGKPVPYDAFMVGPTNFQFSYLRFQEPIA